MSVLRKISPLTFRVVIVVLAVGLAIWQYDLVANHGERVSRSKMAAELQFTMNDGRVVQLPGDTAKYSVVVFWSLGSERSMGMVREIMEADADTAFDALFDFYAVNLTDSVEAMRQQVDFDNHDLPFGYRAEGLFLSKYQIRSLPLTVVFTGTGAVFNAIEGYEEGALAGQLKSVITARKFLGPSGEFKFHVE
jgi:thioredoxin-related protein